MVTPRRGRSGFTLIELLVVIAIIAVLVGMLLPAVQKVREAANKSTCANNLKQLAIAVHNYEGVYSVLPVNSQGYNYGAWSWSAQSPQSSWSWIARVLPYIEQDNLYRQGNIPNSTFGSVTGVLATPIKNLFCPSDNAASQAVRTDRFNLEGASIAVTNYKGVSGSNWCWGNYVNNGPSGNCDGLSWGDGIFYRDDWMRQVRLAGISDGTSNTYMVGEDVPDWNYHCSWPYSNNAVGTCGIPPNAKPGGGGTYAPTDWPNVYSFHSKHINGLQFAMADGSVRSVSNTISLATYRALATKAGGEVVNDN
jgi:prepilin-type N-terminal cleavage/methylation domain-containing protein